MSADQWVNSSRERINQWLETYLPNEEGNLLHQAMRYSVMNGGKRLRSALIFSLESPLSIDPNISNIIAFSIETIHAASLVHDDLPALDNDHLRRNHEACHIKYGEDIAILVGDALMIEGIETLVNMPEDLLCPSDTNKIIKKLTHAIGCFGLMCGQVQDLKTKHTVLTLETLEDLYFKKTCLLLSVGLEAMVIAAQQEAMLKPLMTCIKHVGLGYQIQDDVLDLESSTAALGKPQYSDLNQQKTTMPSLIGLQASKDRVDYHFSQARYILDHKLKTLIQFRAIIDFIQKRQH